MNVVMMDASVLTELSVVWICTDRVETNFRPA